MKKKKLVEEEFEEDETTEEEKEEAVEEKEEATKPVKKKHWSVGQVAIQTENVLLNNKTQEQYTIELALAKILNDIEDIKRLLE